MAEKEPMTANSPSEHSDQKPLRIRRGFVESVDLYEIKDSELDLLDKGSPASFQLNFSIFLLSIAFTSIACLATATFKDRSVEIIFIVIGVIGILLGAYLLLSWYRSRTSIRDVVKTIRNRIHEEVSPQPPETSPKDTRTGIGADEPVG